MVGKLKVYLGNMNSNTLLAIYVGKLMETLYIRDREYACIWKCLFRISAEVSEFAPKSFRWNSIIASVAVPAPKSLGKTRSSNALFKHILEGACSPNNEDIRIYA